MFNLLLKPKKNKQATLLKVLLTYLLTYFLQTKNQRLLSSVGAVSAKSA